MEIAEKGIREDIMIQEIIAFLGRRGEFFYISVFMLLMFFIFLISWLIEPRRLITGRFLRYYSNTSFCLAISFLECLFCLEI